ncbi:MAG: hypothetical protein K1X72_01100 [Pyrinomonadaceae bacterium]|nr:hypothetical protein [Pyrinomonadaceae bacterium]
MKLSSFKNNWTKLVLVLSLMGSVLSLTGLAQDKPFEANSVTMLINQLKEIVSGNSPNTKDAELVAEKWAARQDLAGKSKTAVIDLLYDDVKSVIKEPGTQTQLYWIFSIYKLIPDESFAVQTRTAASSLSKKQAVTRLFELTARMNQYIGTDELLALARQTEATKAEIKKSPNFWAKKIDAALKVNNKLTPDQKSFVKANYEHLEEMAFKINNETNRKNFPVEEWRKEGLKLSYTRNFSVRELNDLIAYFEDTAGQQSLRYAKLKFMAEFIGIESKSYYPKADRTEYLKFTDNAPGRKFMIAYLTDPIKYEQGKSSAVYKKIPNADGLAIWEKANLNKLINQFVTENYKK